MAYGNVCCYVKCNSLCTYFRAVEWTRNVYITNDLLHIRIGLIGLLEIEYVMITANERWFDALLVHTTEENRNVSCAIIDYSNIWKYI